jgi:short-subunit dehydrogenase
MTELDRLARQVGAVDVLVSNAGFAWYGPTGQRQHRVTGRRQRTSEV